MKKQPSDLKKHIGFWMRLVSNNVSGSFAQKIENFNVTVAEWVVLREMHNIEGIISPSMIAEATGLTRGAISKIIDRLIDKQFVTRKDGAVDRRFQEIKQTSKGLNLTITVAAIADQNDEEYFSVLTKQEKKELILILQKVAERKKLTKQMPIN